MGLAKTHGIQLLCQEEHNRSDADKNIRQLTRTTRLGGLERGGRHGLKPMLGRPSTSSVTAEQQHLAAYANSSHGVGAASCLVWAKGGRAGMMQGTKVVVWALARARTSRHP